MVPETKQGEDTLRTVGAMRVVAMAQTEPSSIVQRLQQEDLVGTKKHFKWQEIPIPPPPSIGCYGEFLACKSQAMLPLKQVVEVEYGGSLT